MHAQSPLDGTFKPQIYDYIHDCVYFVVSFSHLLFFSSSLLPCSMVCGSGVLEALGKDEAGDRMAALELYNGILSSVSLGLGQVMKGVGPAMAELRKKLEK